MTVDDLIGKPYLLGARGPDAYDCAGLVVELMRRQGFDFEVPASTESPARNLIAMQSIIARQWTRIGNPRRGCLVFLKPDHVAVMLSRRRFIHACEDIGQVCVEYLDGGIWRQRVDGFYELGGAQ